MLSAAVYVIGVDGVAPESAAVKVATAGGILLPVVTGARGADM